MLIEDIKVGTRVRCTYDDGVTPNTKGKLGWIYETAEDDYSIAAGMCPMYRVRDEHGLSIGTQWAAASSFDKVEGLVEEDFFLGAEVRCVVDYKLNNALTTLGLLGLIADIYKHSNGEIYYYKVAHRGTYGNSETTWMNQKCWERLAPAVVFAAAEPLSPIFASVPAPKATTISIELEVAPEKKPCPLHYYGEGKCSGCSRK